VANVKPVSNEIFKAMHFPPSYITPILYVGNYGNGAELYVQNPLDIRAVLNVSTEPPYQKRAGIGYLEVPFDDGAGIPEKEFLKCMEFMMFQYESGHRTLVHCAAGVSRSVSIAAAFMHLSDQMQFDGALQHIRHMRPIAMPHPQIVTSVRKHLKIWPYDGSYK
jgi:histidinol-phosphate aminotransferase